MTDPAPAETLLQRTHRRLARDDRSGASFWRYMQFFSLVVVLLMIGIGTVIYVLNQRVALERQRIADDNRLLAEVNQLGQLVVDLEAGQRGYFLTGRQSYLEPYEQAVKDIRPVMGNIAGKLRTERDKMLFVRIQSSVDHKLVELTRSFEIAQTQGRIAAVEFIATDIGKALMDDLRTDLQALRDAVGRDIFQRMDGVTELSKTRDGILLSLIFIAALVSLASLFLLR